MGDYREPCGAHRVLGTEHSSISVSIRSPADTLPTPLCILHRPLQVMFSSYDGFWGWSAASLDHCVYLSAYRCLELLDA